MGDDCNDARFTDRIFDNDDYALPDGAHIQFSTAHACVHAGDRGSINASGSAFGIPPSARLTSNGESVALRGGRVGRNAETPKACV